MNNAQIIFEMKGGSHAYGLNTPQSDEDLRGVYLSTDIGNILGLQAGRDECRVTQNEQTDSNFTELRQFLRQLRKGNTNAIEMVFVENVDATGSFKLIRDNREKLIDSVNLVKVLKGYAQGERKLANGERTGKLGGKRKEALDKYGFSPKNFVQLFRLLWAGQYFYTNGVFPVEVKKYNKLFWANLMVVKTEPHLLKVEDLNRTADDLEALLDAAFASTKVKMEFNENLANDIIFQAYEPLLLNYASQSR